MQELIERLRSFAEYEADLADESKWERIEWEAADLIESQAEAIEKYKALCDQMGVAISKCRFDSLNMSAQDMVQASSAFAAWRAMK